jgi:diguanylate cyclase (GGDEF)-like protein
MEVKRYIVIVLRRWWLVLIASIVVFAATAVFTFSRPPQYEVKVRLIVSPTAGISVDLDRQRASLGTLSDKPTIVNTYAEITQSPHIVRSAYEQLSIPPDQQEDLAVKGSVLHNTNILVITVTGSDPVLVHQLAETVSQLVLDYVAELYEVYDLKLLDPAILPEEPIGPDTKLNLAIGVVLGLGLGVLSAFLAEYLKAPMAQVAQASIVDAQTGAYTIPYFLRRLREEISRSKRIQRTFVVGVMHLEDSERTAKFTPDARQTLLRQVTNLLKQTLSEENLVAQWREGAVALLMPDCDLEAAQQTVERLQTKLAWTPLEIGDTGFKWNLTVRFGLTEYAMNGATPEELLERAERTLQEA